MATLLIKNAQTIVTCDQQDRVLTQANLLIKDGVIAYIGPQAQVADRTIDASHHIVYPGLINTHQH